VGLDASLCPYSPKCVEGEFCEVRGMFVIVQPEKLHEALPRVYAAYTAQHSC
jgi:hypothetical protein